MKTFFLIVSLLVFSNLCNEISGQEFKTMKEATIVVEIFTPTNNMIKSGHFEKAHDTLGHDLFIVFENYFNDSIVILKDSTIIFKGNISSNRSTSLARVIHDENQNSKSNSIFTVIILDKKEYFMFKPRKGYKLLYINFRNDKFYLSYSNYFQTYY